MNKKKIIILILLLIVLINPYSVVWAKNNSKIQGVFVKEIAQPIINISIEQSNQCLTELSEETKVDIYIKNYDEQNKISNVTQKVNIDLYIDDGNIELSNFDITAVIDEEELNIYNGSIEEIYLDNSEKEEKKIEIKIKLNKNCVVEHELIGKIKARINTNQVEPN